MSLYVCYDSAGMLSRVEDRVTIVTIFTTVNLCENASPFLASRCYSPIFLSLPFSYPLKCKLSLLSLAAATDLSK